MYMQAHGFHWNVVGPDFPEYHAFFELIYSEVYDSIDGIAEHIRACGGYAPFTHSDMSMLTTISEDPTISPGISMVSKLQQANELVLLSLKKAYKLAESVEEIGVSNYLQDRYDAHTKHGWMLRSTLRPAP